VHIPREDLNLSAGPDTVVRAKMILHSSRNRTIGWSLPADKRGCRSTITITSSTNPEYQFHAYGTSGGVSAFLKKGVYTVIINNGHCVDGTGFIAVRWDSTAIGHTTTPLYGVRCKKIAYYTTDKRLAKVTSFQYGAAHSMVLQPYQRTMYEVKDNASYSGFICSWTVFMASQVYTLGFPEAPHYYENITQYEDSLGTQGKKTYLYSFANDIVSNAIPGLVPTNYGWLRGQLKRVDYYTRADTAFRPLRTTEYVYNTLHNSDEFWDFQNSPKTQHDVNILGLYVRRILTGNSNAAGGCNIYDYGYYKLPSAVQYLSKQIDTWYTPTGIHQNTKRYYVTNFTHLQPSVTTQILSATDSLVTRTTYAADYISTAPSPDAPSEALATLNRQHRLTTPIEEVTFRMGRLTQATLRTYRPLTIPVLDKLYRAEVAIPTSAFVAATSMNGKFVFNPTYREALAYDIYNRASEPLQITANKHQTQAYLWNETHQQLVAVVRNAYYSQVAVTSFELGSTGRWQYDSTGYHVQVGGYTGQRAYRLDGQWGIRREQLPAGEYELTYWQQGSSIPQLYCSSNGKVVGGGRILLATNPQGWQQFRTRLQFAGTGSVKIDVNAGDLLTLDELRLIPIGARATSYTYKTLVGETSQTGPDGRTIFYDYDTLGRLIRTRDEQGRILSQQQYHYAGAK
jgi:YD repeat-containing protein